MHYPVGRSHALAWGIAVAAVAGLLVLLAWWGMGTVHRWALAGALGLWLACTALAGHFWQQSPVGVLVWDGQTWHFQGHAPERTGPSVSVHLDLQHSLWLCLRCAQGPVLWLWLEQHHSPLLWADLRRAVYSRPRPDPADTPADPHDRTFSG